MAGDLNINSGSRILAISFQYWGCNWTRVRGYLSLQAGKTYRSSGASVQTVMVSPTGTETYFSLTKSGTGTLKLTTGTNATATGASGSNISFLPMPAVGTGFERTKLNPYRWR